MLNQKYFILSLTLLLSGISCRKYIYQAPIDSVYSGDFWTSQTSVEQSAMAMYNDLRYAVRGESDGGVSSHFIWGDLVTGTFVPNSTQWNYTSLESTNTPPFDFDYVPYLEPTLEDWTPFYQIIAQANLILQNVPSMNLSLFSSTSGFVIAPSATTNAGIRNSYLAEALFMRAYTYFYMIRIWGDPVYVTKTYDNVDFGNIPPLPRTPEATVLDSSLTDLRVAANYCAYEGGNPTMTIRANKGTIYSLMAEIFAWRHQYDSCDFYCKQVINNAGYSLEPMATYTNIWNGQSSLESIFELPMTYSANDPNFQSGSLNAEAQFGFFGTWLKGPIVQNYTSNCWIAPQGGLVDQVLFDTSIDMRYHTIFVNMAASNGDPAGYMMTKYSNFFYQQPSTSQYPYLNNDLVLIRLADIILLDAEALAYQNQLGAAANMLSQTEQRAGISSYMSPPTGKSAMLDSVIAERGRELIGEGQWFYDLIRTDSTQHWLEDQIGYPAARVTTTNKGYYWPLNLSTLFPQDNLLTQNPWWSFNN